MIKRRGIYHQVRLFACFHYLRHIIVVDASARGFCPALKASHAVLYFFLPQVNGFNVSARLFASPGKSPCCQPLHEYPAE